ncbi:MAG: efflux RND transporter periplasmic adaptor subunit [Gemmatimonadota bacterium]
MRNTWHVGRGGARIALAAGVLLAAGCGGDGDAATGDGGSQPTPVRAGEAVADTVVEEVRATGEIEAIQSIELRPEVSGRLVRILAREGTEVRRGTPLFKVDDAEIRAEVNRLDAEHDLAEQALTRTRELLERNASSTADLERAEATARSTRAQLDLQRTRLERTVVRAPFSGIVGERLVSLGDYVTPSTPLTSLQTVDPQRASFAVPERYAQELAEGQTVTFNVAAIPDRRFAGTVDFVDPRVQLPGRTITVKAVVENPERLLRPGMFVEARLATEMRPNAVVVPEEAILPLGGANYVWAITEENTASRVEVELGVRRPGSVEVRSGLSPGDRVVTGGQTLLYPDAPVTVTEGADAGQAEAAPGDGADPGDAGPDAGQAEAAPEADAGGDEPAEE